jgi:hypothetical protein
MMLVAMLAALFLGCPEYGVNGRGGYAESDGSGGSGTGARTVFTVVVRDAYSGTWTAGVVDRSRACYTELDDATDYRGCCPEGFTPVGWPGDTVDYTPKMYVVCLEDAAGTGRSVVYIGGGSLDGWDEHWGSSPSSANGGTWSGGVYTTTACASDVRYDGLPDNLEENPPDDFTACCPPAFTPVGQARGARYDDVVCLEDL